MKKIFLAISAAVMVSCFSNSPVSAEIKSYEDCLKAGNPVRKSLPAQCVTSEGKIFIDPAGRLEMPQVAGKICKDLCGDGQCAEIVCMAAGCPCAETPESCPQDCKPA